MQEKLEDECRRYTAEALVRAMAPVRWVVHRFVQEETYRQQQTQPTPQTVAQSTEESCCSPTKASDNVNFWANTEAQDAFSDVLLRLCPFEPSTSSSLCPAPCNAYLTKVLREYIRLVEKHDGTIDSENLTELVLQSMYRQSKSEGGESCYDGGMPCPDIPSHVSFHVPQVASNLNPKEIQSCPKVLLAVRTYPHHNDVGVRKVWEAGACLAEYLLFVCNQNNNHNSNPNKCPNSNSASTFMDLRNKTIVELGAGVGLTGLVAHYACAAQKVILTDYTTECLENLEYNVQLNQNLYNQEASQRGSVEDFSHRSCEVQVAKLDWRDFLTNDNNDYNQEKHMNSGGTNHHNNKQDQNQLFKSSSSHYLIEEADMLLAADVVYDPQDVPLLVSILQHFFHLSGDREKCAVFATTKRNQDTFEYFCQSIMAIPGGGSGGSNSVSVTQEEVQNVTSLPHVFPCYFHQPRKDVKLCVMRSCMVNNSNSSTNDSRKNQ